MAEKVLSVFIDESGDFGPYDFHAPFYLVAMVLHDQELDFHYACAKIRKVECPDVIVLTARISKTVAEILRSHQDFWEKFSRVIIYYDNGQIELTKILTSVFNTLYAHVEFRKVKPVDYKLFQVADLVCTMELLAEKADANSFSKSEQEFFCSVRDFKKNYLKPLLRKQL